MKITTRTTLAQIRNQLAADGYEPECARDVKRAAMHGCLLWTSEKLVTTDGSRIAAFPASAWRVER